MKTLWNKETETEFFTESLKEIDPTSLFYTSDDGKMYAYWPKTYTGKKSTLQSRNTHVGNFTEMWTKLLLEGYAQSKGYFAVQGAICKEIGLPRESAADVAICKSPSKEQNPKDIVAIFEVKMSIVWNWELKNGEIIELGDYSTHKGEPGLLRSDSMLKAIGKGINVRISSPDSKDIPIIILGNTPITQSYESKVDNLKTSGVVQGFWSLNPNPRNNQSTLKNTPKYGFIRMDNYQELVKNLDNLLSEDLNYFSSMKSHSELGRIIDISSRENIIEDKALKFLELIGD
ncbi:hypothetical protein [Methanofollis ethanolicus]|uniref:hypothetical protein n=1 Tax=Methanofollis ethanolicus TaxID=488124 RepID=UPI00082D891B|nr:hypothetical protein [Methanofollis ethanolicus]